MAVDDASGALEGAGAVLRTEEASIGAGHDGVDAGAEDGALREALVGGGVGLACLLPMATNVLMA